MIIVYTFLFIFYLFVCLLYAWLEMPICEFQIYSAQNKIQKYLRHSSDALNYIRLLPNLNKAVALDCEFSTDHICSKTCGDSG